MKKFIIGSIVLVGLLSDSYAIDRTKKTQALKAIKHIKRAWQSKLTEELKSDSKGFSAVNFCYKNAIKIAKQVSDMYPGIILKRVAIRYRNSDNKASKIDLPILKEFEMISKLRKTPSVKVIETKNSYRVYQPLIIRKPVCLKCHGNAQRMRKKLVAVIDEKYPKDKAKNFRYRESRGAIVAIIKK